MPPFKLKESDRLLQALQAGTIYSPLTSLLMMCAPSTAALLQPEIEHSLGQGFLEPLIQCFFQDPQLQERSAVPFLFFHPVAGILIE